MNKTYLIFVNPSDIYSYAKIVCEKEELDNALVEAELIDPGTTISDYSWVVFEDGEMIQG